MSEPISTDLAPAGHDDHLYDPERHDNQIVALYESAAQAGAARDALHGAGVDLSAMQVIDNEHANGAAPAREGLWHSIKSLFAPDDDANAYDHALSRGHSMLVVTPAATSNRSHIIEMLERTDPVDFDAKLEEWRQAGYDNASSAGTDPAETGVAAATFDPPDHASKTDRSQDRPRTGKRESADGAVRVRSYVSERPIAEQVRLHEEQIGSEAENDHPAQPGSASIGGMDTPRS